MKFSQQPTGLPGTERALDQVPLDQSSPEAQSVDASTRQRVAQSILEHGPSTATDLAGRLGLSAAGVRRHLDVLAERGQVVAREQRVYGSRGRGRPAKVFALTDTGRSDFYQAYDDLAIQALTVLADQAGPGAVALLGRQRIAGVTRRYDEHRDKHRDGDRSGQYSPAASLAAALSDEGYVASVKPSAAGEQLCQHHCPVAHVAEQFPQLCEIETELFSELLGVHVQRLATIAHGDGVCTTHIPRTGRSDSRPPDRHDFDHDFDNDRPQLSDPTQGRDQI